MWKRSINWLLPVCTGTGDPTCPTRDRTCSPGKCPDWESNPQPFGCGQHSNQLSLTSQGSPSIFLCKLFSMDYFLPGTHVLLSSYDLRLCGIRLCGHLPTLHPVSDGPVITFVHQTLSNISRPPTYFNNSIQRKPNIESGIILVFMKEFDWWIYR